LPPPTRNGAPIAPRGRRAGPLQTPAAAQWPIPEKTNTLRFEELGLSADLLQTVVEEGYEDPTPVQERAIPLILAGRDVLAAAQTGTGKTAAFTLPILDRLRPYANTSFSPARHPVRCLVLTPTRELAVQVSEAIKTYGRKVPLRAAVVYGGVPLDPQIKELLAGVEILVATPGVPRT
jgi:ATP-dependent RNA helicase RhlE